MSEDAQRPPFPIEILPPAIRAMAEAVAAFSTTGQDMTAATAMAVLNCAISGGVRIGNRRHPERRTPSGTFNVTVGVSGSGKSVVGGLLMEPLYEFERQEQARFEREVRPGLEADRIEVEAEIKLLTAEATRSQERNRDDKKGRHRRLSELLRRRREIEDRLHPPQYIVEDITSQSFPRLLVTTGGRILILSTDAREIVANLLGRYNNGRADDSALLRAYSGEGLKFTRKGLNGQLETINIPHTAMGLHIMIQPDKATEMAEKRDLQEGGLLQRMLFVWTDNHPGRASLSRPIPPAISEAYRQRIMDLFRVYFCAKKEVVFYLSDEAWQELEDYREEAQLAAGDGSHPSWPFRARNAEHACRLSAGLHAGDHGTGAHEIDIPVGTVRRAIQAMRYYDLDRMMIADSMADRSNEKVLAKLRELAMNHPNGFGCRDAQRKRIAGMHKDAKAVQEILDLKLKDGVLQRIEGDPPRYRYVYR